MKPLYLHRIFRHAASRATLLAGLFLFLFQAAANAQSATAVNSGNWSDAATWDPSTGAPDPGEAVIINPGVTLSVDVTETVSSIQINSGGAGTTATLAFTSTGDLTVTGYITLGTMAGGAGILNMNSGGTLTTDGFAMDANALGSGFSSGTGSVTLTGNNTLPSVFTVFNNLHLTGGKVTHVTADLKINSALLIDAASVLDLGTGRLINGGSASFTNSGTIETQNTSSTPLPISATGALTGGAVLYNAAAGGQQIVAGTYNNLYISHSGAGATESIALGTLNVGGEIATLTAGTTLNMRTFKLENTLNGGIGSNNNVGTIRTQYVGTDALPAGRTWGGTVVYDAPTGGQKVIFGTYSNLTVSVNGTNTSSSIVVTGNFVTSPTTTLQLFSETLTGTFDASGHQGTLLVQATEPFPAGKTWGGTVVYNSNQVQTVRTGSYHHLTITGFRSFDLTLQSGTIGVSGDLLFDATLESNGAFIKTGNTFNFNGADAQSIAVSAREIDPVTVPFVFNNVTLTGGGAKTLSTPASLAGVLNLTNGVLLTSDGSLLTLQTGATITGGSINSYVEGPLRRIGETDFVFPLGGSGVFAPLGLGAAGAGGDFTARYVRSSGLGLGSAMGAGVVRVSRCEYWNVVKGGGATNPAITLNWSAESPCDGGPYVVNTSTMRVVRFANGQWNSLGNAATSGGAGAGSVTSGIPTGYDNITLGSSDIENPLPVKFISVQARKQNGGVVVSWKTATEYNVDHYEIEQSTNGRSFGTAAQVRATVNNGSGASYEGFDARAVNGTSFYRVKAVDIDGKLTYSSVVRLSDDKAPAEVTVYPNPVRARNITFQAANMESGVYEVTIVDVSGRVVLRTTLEHAGGTVSKPLPLPGGIAPGLYSLRLSGNGSDTLKSFLVQ